MKVVFGFQHSLALMGLGFALTVASGCENSQTTTTTAIPLEPKLSSPKGAVEDLKKDIKPPVVVKPNTTPATGEAPAPKHE